MNDAQLRRQMDDQNPWWRTPDWEADDPALRAVAGADLQYEPQPLVDIRDPGLYVLRGPRRVGKSVEIKRAIASLVRRVPPRSVLYCSCEGLSAQDLRRLVVSAHSQTRTLAGPRYWFLDEVTAVSGWSSVIKNLRDTHPEFSQALVVLAGSSAWDLRDAVSHLAGRRGPVHDSDRLLLPMGFRAFCSNLPGIGRLPEVTVRPADLQTRAGKVALWELEPLMSSLDDAWQLFLQVGGYPQAVSEFVRDGGVSAAFVSDLLDVIKGDVLRNTSLSEAETLALVDRLAMNLCSPVNLSEVAQHVGLRDNDRVNDRLNGLVNNFLGWRCFRAKDGVPSPRSQRKIYFMDPLVAQLANQRNPSFAAVDASKLNEQQVGLALNRCLTRGAPVEFIESGAVMYDRTPTDAEIDFVGPGLPTPVECKYVDSGWKREAQTLRTRHGRGIVATRGVFDLDEAVWAVPAAVLAWILGY